MTICSTTSYPFGLLPISKRPPLDTLKFIVTILRNKDKKVAFIQVDEDGALTISSECMKKYHNMNIIVQNIGGDTYYINGKCESPNKKFDNITRYILLNSS